MDKFAQFKKRLERVDRSRNEIKAAVEQLATLKAECDKAWEKVSKSVIGITPYEEELLTQFRSIFPVDQYTPRGNGTQDESESMIEGLVRVLESSNRWMSIKALTNIALASGVNTTSDSPHRVFSTVLSSEGSKPNSRVILKDGRWGLKHWQF